MTTFNELIANDLTMPGTYAKIQGLYLECLEHLLIPESRRLADLLEKKLAAIPQATHLELYKKYEQMTVMLKFVALVTLDENNLLKLFQFHLLDALNGRIDINDRLTGRMYLLPETAFETETNRMIEALKQNKQRLGSQPIVLKEDSEPTAPMVKYWLSDYDRYFGPEKQTTMEQEQYLSHNPNVALLTPLEKNVLRQILQLYDNLKPISLALIDKYQNLAESTGAEQKPAAPKVAPALTAPRGERSELYEAAPTTKASSTIIAPSSTPIAQTPAATTVTQKTLRQIAQENKEALNQTLTTAPIKIADFDQPVRPTIKNWLVDYVKMKGAGHHESLERSNYLFNSLNTRTLADKERNLLAEILKAYDDDLPLPVNSQDQTILLDKLTGSNFNAPMSQKRAPQTIPAEPRGERSELYGAAPNGNYREPISEKDLSGPLKPTPPKTAPRLSGNIIDLKDLQ